MSFSCTSPSYPPGGLSVSVSAFSLPFSWPLRSSGSPIAPQLPGPAFYQKLPSQHLGLHPDRCPGLSLCRASTGLLTIPQCPHCFILLIQAASSERNLHLSLPPTPAGPICLLIFQGLPWIPLLSSFRICCVGRNRFGESKWLVQVETPAMTMACARCHHLWILSTRDAHVTCLISFILCNSFWRWGWRVGSLNILIVQLKQQQ